MYSHIEVSIIIPLYFNQKNTQTLEDLITSYSKYSQETLSKVEFIFIDDCSPIQVEIQQNVLLNFHLLRITDDIQWNQSGAKNLGATYSKGQKIIFSDTDHLFPEKILKKIITSKVPKHLYHFKTQSPDGNHHHRRTPGILYCSKSTFFLGQGYDEEFSGYYGCEDVFYRENLKKKSIKFKYFSRLERVISLAVNREDSYHSLERNFDRNLALLNSKLQQLKSKKPEAAHSKIFLNFEWTSITKNYLNYSSTIS
jgi:predicted glycosyltransferase involved in capsule biosynthesis